MSVLPEVNENVIFPFSLQPSLLFSGSLGLEVFTFFTLNNNSFSSFGHVSECLLLISHSLFKMCHPTLNLRLGLNSFQNEVIKENSLLCLLDSILLYIIPNWHSYICDWHCWILWSTRLPQILRSKTKPIWVFHIGCLLCCLFVVSPLWP